MLLLDLENSIKRLWIKVDSLQKKVCCSNIMPSYTTAPSNPVAGQFFFNTSTNHMEYFNGTTWVSI